MFPSPSCARKETAARTGLRSHRGRSGYRVLASPLSFNVAVARRIASFACRAGAGCPVTAEVTTLVEDRRRRLLAFRWVASLLAVFWVSFLGLIDLFVFLQGATFHEALLLETGWGLLFVFLSQYHWLSLPSVRVRVPSSPVDR